MKYSEVKKKLTLGRKNPLCKNCKDKKKCDWDYVCSNLRQYIDLKGLREDPIQEINRYQCTMGLSVSQAIRRYTNIHGLPKGF